MTSYDYCSAKCLLQNVLHDKEVYLNIAGGLKIQEPSADLAVVASLISSVVNLPLPTSSIICGEVALSGEIGFKKAIIPKNGNYSSHDIEIIKLGHIKELREILITVKYHLYPTRNMFS